MPWSEPASPTWWSAGQARAAAGWRSSWRRSSPRSRLGSSSLPGLLALDLVGLLAQRGACLAGQMTDRLLALCGRRGLLDVLAGGCALLLRRQRHASLMIEPLASSYRGQAGAGKPEGRPSGRPPPAELEAEWVAGAARRAVGGLVHGRVPDLGEGVADAPHHVYRSARGSELEVEGPLVRVVVGAAAAGPGAVVFPQPARARPVHVDGDRREPTAARAESDHALQAGTAAGGAADRQAGAGHAGIGWQVH